MGLEDGRKCPGIVSSDGVELQGTSATVLVLKGRVADIRCVSKLYFRL